MSFVKNPVAKYFLGRIGLFAIVAAPLVLFTPIHYLLALAVGLLASMLLSMVVLRGQRTAMIDHIDARMKDRKEEKERLRAELKGDS